MYSCGSFLQLLVMFSITVYVPATHAQGVRNALAASKAGNVRTYDSCSFSSVGVGRFRPLPGANPTIGSIGVVEEVAEEKIESICLEEFLTPVCDAVKAAHPYEEPAIHVTRVLDYASFLSANSIPAGLALGAADNGNNSNGSNDSNSNSNSRVSSQHAPLPDFGPISVVLEGLDGVGKSTVAAKLAEALGAQHRSTPPPLMAGSRPWFVRQGGEMRKAFYMVGNFVAGAEMQQLVQGGQSVVLDRYYASTIAYIIGKEDRPLPTGGEEGELAWPEELYRPSYMFLLALPEQARIRRRSARTGVEETAEEVLLRESPKIPERINALYELLGCQRVDLEESDDVDRVVGKIIECIRVQQRG